jgi:ATP-dependent DNA ligase
MMSIPFESFKLIYPPHPAVTWHPKDFHNISRFIAQYKYDDWRVLIYFFPNGTIDFYNRKKEKLPRFQAPAKLLDSLQKLNLPHGCFHVLDGGLLHYKTSRVKNTIVLWDILVFENRWLIGSSYKERYKILKSVCGNPLKNVTLKYRKDGKAIAVDVALEVTKHLWLARSFRGNFRELFEKARPLAEIEGLVLKDPNAKLQRPFKMTENAKWLIRVRKPRIDYNF